MKQNAWVTAVIALLLLILPLPALPEGLTLPSLPDTSDEESTSSPSPILEDSFDIWDEEQEKVITMNAREFIFYTVAAEMPVSFGTEALKAQAVASYTYFCYQRAQQERSPSESLRRGVAGEMGQAI